jgi:hypothetical protein
MQLSKLIILILLLNTTNKSYSKKNYSFKKIIHSNIIGKVFINKSNEDTCWRTYLGKIYDKKKKVKYYVIKEFSKNKAASTWHGHSNIYIFGLSKILFASINVGMPDNLPYKYYNNTFYFHYKENNVLKIYKTKIETPIPKIFCCEPSGCDAIIFE